MKVISVNCLTKKLQLKLIVKKIAHLTVNKNIQIQAQASPYPKHRL